jgi:hypothetical protein
MNKQINEEYDHTLYPLTDMFENVSKTNYLQYAQVANIQYNFLNNHKNASGFHFVNWRVNYASLHDYIIENEKSGVEISTFLKYYEESAPLLYAKLGLEY